MSHPNPGEGEKDLVTPSGSGPRTSRHSVRVIPTQKTRGVRPKSSGKRFYPVDVVLFVMKYLHRGPKTFEGRGRGLSLSNRQM